MALLALRRSFLSLLARGLQRGARWVAPEGEPEAAPPPEAAGGPPAHWLEHVRSGPPAHWLDAVRGTERLAWEGERLRPAPPAPEEPPRPSEDAASGPTARAEDHEGAAPSSPPSSDAPARRPRIRFYRDGLVPDIEPPDALDPAREEPHADERSAGEGRREHLRREQLRLPPDSHSAGTPHDTPRLEPPRGVSPPERRPVVPSRVVPASPEDSAPPESEATVSIRVVPNKSEEADSLGRAHPPAPDGGNEEGRVAPAPPVGHDRARPPERARGGVEAPLPERDPPRAPHVPEVVRPVLRRAERAWPEASPTEQRDEQRPSEASLTWPSLLDATTDEIDEEARETAVANALRSRERQQRLDHEQAGGLWNA